QTTAIYTALEQYGGDSGHTDARTDIYAFSATLYHLLTNQSPPVARERFLAPESLASMRQINPAISQRTERAILTGLNLHPNDRPESIETFKQMLFGNENYSFVPSVPRPFKLRDIFRPSIENVLVWICSSLMLISLLVSVLM
ncbi:MAG: serine/threonine protein kinase, partial [Anaerolineae bacterium]|nr:serine/threonine protein kinase [Anaerolineae bacterium]